MTARIIDGKGIAKEIRHDLAKEVEQLMTQGRRPGLAVVLVGDNPASAVYVRSKKRACEEIGVHSVVHTLAEDVTQADLLTLIEKLNSASEIHGILVQLPLPQHLNEAEVINSILPSKDVDGFHPINVGKMHIGEESFVPCTPAGVVELVKRAGTTIAGAHVVVIGRSNIVGKPAASLFLKEHATVTICHSRTKDVASECRRADILIAAVGVPELVKKDWIKPGATVIDVGINRVNGKLVGDVDFAGASQVAAAITPVPGGVGPMTIAMLLKATVDAASKA